MGAITLDNIMSVSDLSHGKASAAVDKASNGQTVVIMRNNRPAAIMLSPQEYTAMTEAVEDAEDCAEAVERLSRLERGETHEVSDEEVMAELGITEEDIANAEEPEIG